MLNLIPVNFLLVLGSERVNSDMKRRFENRPNGEEPVTVIRLPKSEGCVDRDERYMRQLRQLQIREYFFGNKPGMLSPYTQMLDYSQLTIYRVADRKPDILICCQCSTFY